MLDDSHPADRDTRPAWRVTFSARSTKDAGDRGVVHQYSFDPAHQRMHVRLSGVLTLDGLWAMLQDLQGDARLTPAGHVVIDLREVRSVGQIHHDDLRTVAATRLPDVNRCALIAQEPAVFGICRMWAALRDLVDESQAVEVFRSLLAAEAWLESPPATPEA